jgi:hypothetical protein
VAANGVIMVARQVVALGRVHAHTEVAVHVAEHTLTVEHADGAQRTFRRTTDFPVRSWKAQHPRAAPNRRPPASRA